MRTFILILSMCMIATLVYGEEHTVKRVMYDYTLILTNGQRVRLIGIEFPQSDTNDKVAKTTKQMKQNDKPITKMGQKATLYFKSLFEGKGYNNLNKVVLEYDVQKKDQYGVTYAYVYMPKLNKYGQTFYKDGAPVQQFLNAHLIEQGYAAPSTETSNKKYEDLFKKLYAQARRESRGLWKNMPVTEYLESSLYCQKDEECSLREGACGYEPMNIYFDNSELIKMQPFVECSDYIPLENPQCKAGKCVADEVRGEGMVACTMEAKRCPDGSYVSRVGPNCEFKTCPE